MVPPPPTPPPPREVAAAAAAAAAVLVLRALEICDIESSVGNWRLAAEVMAGLVVVVTPPTVTPVEVVVKPFNPAGKWNSFSLLLNSSGKKTSKNGELLRSHGGTTVHYNHLTSNFFRGGSIKLAKECTNAFCLHDLRHALVKL